MRVSFREAKRVAVFVAGSLLLVVGGALLVLPGPGLPFVFLGLGILASEYEWARRWLAKLRATAAQAGQRASRWRFWRKDPQDKP